MCSELWVDLGLEFSILDKDVCVCVCACVCVCVCAGVCSISKDTGVETSSYGVVCPRIFPRISACTMGGKH